MRLIQVVILRGLNVVGRSKTPDFMPFNNLGVLDSLASLGTNVARLPFIWEAYEPVRGQFNTTYYDYYQRVVEVRGYHGPSTVLGCAQAALKSPSLVQP